MCSGLKNKLACHSGNSAHKCSVNGGTSTTSLTHGSDQNPSPDAKSGLNNILLVNKQRRQESRAHARRDKPVYRRRTLDFQHYLIYFRSKHVTSPPGLTTSGAREHSRAPE